MRAPSCLLSIDRRWAFTRVENWRRGFSLLLVGLGFALLVFSSGAQDESRRQGGVMNLGPEAGGSDINLITGADNVPILTQNEASVWGHGSTVVAAYVDSSGHALPTQSYCGVSTSTDGGASFTRLPYKFNSLGSCLGSSSVFFSIRAQKWFIGFRAGSCGSNGVGQWESMDGINWAASGCVFTSSASDLPSTWVDNNPASPFYGRQYALFNDFNLASGAPRVVWSTDDGVTWSLPVTLFSGFRRAVKITGSLGSDGTIFAQLTDEGGGGLNGLRQNLIARSTDGGATWSAPISQGATYFGPGRSATGYFPGMYSTPVAAYWTELGFGRPGVGPNNTVHYTYSARTASPADPGNVYYIRSTNNGDTWSAPLQLNTDSTTRAQWSPSLAVNASGQLVVSWYDERNTVDDSLERYARISRDNGATWEADFPLSDVIFPKPLQPSPGIQSVTVGIYNNAAFSDDNFGDVAYHTWVDGRNSVAGSPQQDVYFDRVTLLPPAVIVVTTLADHDDGVCNAADCTLREAINRANTNLATDRITFRYGLTGIIQLGSTLPAFSGGVILHGPGASLLTVRRNTAAEHRIFTIENVAVTLEGLTISNGFLPATGNLGGGIYNDGGDLRIVNCTLSGNHAYAGGALYNANGGVATLSGCTLTGNSAFEGGAIDNAALGANATLAVSNSTFSGNSASNNGGGISNGALGSGASASLTLTNCTLSDNSSPTGGGLNNGAVFGGGASAVVRNTIFKTGASGANLANSSGTITSEGSNRSNDGGGGFLVGPGDVNNVDPMLGPLQNNGGPTFTRALLAGSAAINTGNGGLAPPNDQRGYLRAGASDIGAFEFNGTTPTLPVLNSAVSRKLHGASPFDINLPLTGTPGVECRSGGAGGNYPVVLSFAAAVNFSEAVVTAGDAVVSSSSGAGTNSLTVNLSDVSNLQTINLRLANLSDGANTGDLNIPIAFLLGDTNGNRTVNATDIGQAKAQSGQPASAANFRADVNVSGAINATDIGQVKAQSGTSLP